MEERIISNAGIRLRSDAQGPAAGAPVLLVMGAMNPAAAWPGSLCGGLADAGFRVLRYDHRDTGRSSQSQGDYTLDELVADAAAVLDGWEAGPAHVVGLSMGGCIGQRLAMDSPARVRTLTLISTTPDHRPYMAATMGRDASGYALPPAQESFLRCLRSPAAAGRRKDPGGMLFEGWRACNGEGVPFDAAATRAMVDRIMAVTDAPRAALRHAMAMSVSAPLMDRLGEIRVPTLVIHGRHDPCFPLPHGEALAEGIAGARLLVLEEMGHMIREDLVPALLQPMLAHLRTR
ncbi:MAG: hypothetical protein A2X36_05890 [Elusimicrobia bacterium GWA2_69_24]|nr:MAG: hypothetical protein A2X36_05890 [Elusimicrobia bacterium GWA2_69_24]HBL16378.1 alpha/beta hydrolase [Elusimicrobiota bacterium]